MNLIDKLVKVLLKDRRQISLQDKMVAAYTKGKKMPLKGHTRVIFTDTVTGEETVVADTTNMVTNAVASILSKNYSGLASLTSILPLKNLYSGVLCFQNEITENADNYNPPNDITNPLIAHAGQTMNNTGNLLRGNPVTSDIVTTDTSVKWVWSWDSSHGNGTIRTVCLCPDVLGNMGLKPYDNTLNPMSAFGNDRTNSDTWNTTRCIEYPWHINSDGRTSVSVWVSGTTFTEYTGRHDYSTFGIMRNSRGWQMVSNRAATIRGGNNSFVFDDDDYYYIARVTSASASSSSMQVDKVNKGTFAVTQSDCTFTGVNLYSGSIDTRDGNFHRFAYDGTYLYYPNNSVNQFYKLNISNPADVDLITGTVTIETGNSSENNVPTMTPVVISPGLILGGTYIINGNTAYPIRHVTNIGTPTADNGKYIFLWVVRQGAAMYGNAIHSGTSSWNWSGQSNVLCSMFLSTINVLEEPVVKTNTVAMRIEYTISEV